MFTAAELAEHRADAESLMQDTFVALRPDPTAVTIDSEGFEVRGYANEGTTQGKIAGPSSQARDTNVRTTVVGGVERPVVEGGMHLPISSKVPKMGEYGAGWEYLLTIPGPATDPSLLNSRWLVLDAPAKSWATARRLNVVRLS